MPQDRRQPAGLIAPDGTFHPTEGYQHERLARSMGLHQLPFWGTDQGWLWVGSAGQPEVSGFRSVLTDPRHPATQRLRQVVRQGWPARHVSMVLVEPEPDGVATKTQTRNYHAARFAGTGVLSPYDPLLHKAEETLAKMAKVHDDAENPRWVYRVQNEHGEGPARGPNIPTTYDRYGLTGTSGGRHTPDRDFPRDELDEMKLGRPDRLFGFDQPEDARYWYGADDRDTLHRLGYGLYRFPASKVWLSDSENQLVFEPAGEGEHHAHLVDDVDADDTVGEMEGGVPNPYEAEEIPWDFKPCYCKHFGNKRGCNHCEHTGVLPKTKAGEKGWETFVSDYGPPPPEDFDPWEHTDDSGEVAAFHQKYPEVPARPNPADDEPESAALGKNDETDRAVRHLERKYPKVEWNVRNAHPDAARALVAAVDRHFTDHPDLRDHTKHVGSLDLMSFQNAQSVPEEGRVLMGSHRIAAPNSSLPGLRGPRRRVETLGPDGVYRRGRHYVLSDTVSERARNKHGATWSHEFGHLLDHVRSGRDLARHHELEEIAQPFRGSVQRVWQSKTAEDIQRVSAYAGKNVGVRTGGGESELFPEAFAALHWTPRRSWSPVVRELFEKLYARRLRKDQPPPTLSGLGVPDNRRETPIVSGRALDLKRRLANAPADDQDYGRSSLTITNDGEAGAPFAVRDGHSVSYAVDRCAALSIGGGGPLATKHHEDFHQMMDRVEQLHGRAGRDAATKALYSAIPANDRAVLDEWVRTSYPSLRRAAAAYHNRGGAPRVQLDQVRDGALKTALRAVRQRAAELRPEDLRLSKLGDQPRQNPAKQARKVAVARRIGKAELAKGLGLLRRLPKPKSKKRYEVVLPVGTVDAATGKMKVETAEGKAVWKQARSGLVMSTRPATPAAEWGIPTSSKNPHG